MRKAAFSFGAIALAGVVALLIVAATSSRTLSFTLGVASVAPVAELRPGAEVCQRPIPVGGAFDEVELHVGTFGRAGQPLELTVRDADGGAELGSGELPAGYADNSRPLVTVGEVPGDGSIAVCVRNAGSRRVALYGGPDAAARSSSAELDGRPARADLDLVFRTADERSALALLPDMLARASLFRGGWIGPWLYWLLLAAAVVGVPLLLWRALALTADGKRQSPREEDAPR